MKNHLYGARFKSWTGGNGLAANITWRNIVLQHVKFPVRFISTHLADYTGLTLSTVDLCYSKLLGSRSELYFLYDLVIQLLRRCHLCRKDQNPTPPLPHPPICKTSCSTTSAVISTSKLDFQTIWSDTEYLPSQALELSRELASLTLAGIMFPAPPAKSLSFSTSTQEPVC